MSRWSEYDIPDQSGRTAVVTGANSGIGYCAARALARRGARVVLACRSEERGTAARDRVLAEVPGAEAEFAPWTSVRWPPCGSSHGPGHATMTGSTCSSTTPG